MKRKQILAKAITLGLLLAMPCSAWAVEITSSYNLEGATEYDNMDIGSGATINGTENKFNVTVTGIIPDYPDALNAMTSIKNSGTMANIGTLTAKGKIENNVSGSINADVVQMEDYKSAHGISNSGNFIVNKSVVADITNYNGNFIYKGTEAVRGSIYLNGGNIYSTTGDLEITGNLIYRNNNGNIGSAENKILLSLKVGGDIYLGNDSDTQLITLDVEDNIQASYVANSGIIKTDKLTTNILYVRNTKTNSFLEVNELNINSGTIGGEKRSGIKKVPYYGRIIVHEKLNFQGIDEKIMNNYGELLFDGEEISVTGDGVINNNITSSNPKVVGLIAKNVDGDKITNLTIEGTLNNNGILAAETLNVAKGADGSGTQESKGFNVDNLNILDEGSFTLNGSEYGFTSVGVGADAALSTTADTVTVEKAIVLDKSASFTAKDVSASDITLGEKAMFTANGAVSCAETVSLGEAASFNANDVSASAISLGESAEFTADGAVSGTEAIALAESAAFKSETLAMTKDGAVVSAGGSLAAAAMSGEGLTFDLRSDKAQQIAVQEFTGNDLKINVTSLTPEQVVIEKMEGSGVTVTGDSQLTDTFEVDNVEAGLQALAYTASVNSTQNGQRKTVLAPAGKILGDLYGETDAANNIIKSSVKESVNPANQGISEMASIALMTWRQENNDMNKRLGELRDSAGEHGVWVRMTRGESKYGNQNIKNQYNAYQLGYDEKLSSDKHWTVGAALTYTDAESSFRNGKGENKHKGLALYGSRLNDDGSFIDLIARYARLEHDFDVRGGAGKGDFDSNGYSLSAEYGKRFTKDNGLWIEPQVELTYGRVSGANYVTEPGVNVRQEGMDSLVGRLGFALGKNLAKNKGNVYLRASYLYDFDGETDVSFSSGPQKRGFTQDLGGGWWEVGVGANVNLSAASHLYFDVEKTYGGNVATPWQWNAGVRWSF